MTAEMNWPKNVDKIDKPIFRHKKCKNFAKKLVKSLKILSSVFVLF